MYLGLCKDNDNSEILNDLNSLKCQTKISYHENYGADIAPFLSQLHDIKEPLFIKIHGKKTNIGTHNHVNWRSILLNDLIGGSDIVESNILALEDKSVGMISPRPLLWSNLEGSNSSKIQHLCSELNIDYNSVKDGYFVAGSMFMSRTKIFKSIFTKNKIIKILELLSAETNKVQDIVNGTYSHSLERIFGYIIKFKNFTINFFNHNYILIKNTDTQKIFHGIKLYTNFMYLLEDMNVYGKILTETDDTKLIQWYHLNSPIDQLYHLSEDNYFISNGSNSSLLDDSKINFRFETPSSISISILLFYPEELSLKSINNICSMLFNKCHELNILKIILNIRNNSLNYNSEIIKNNILNLQEYYGNLNKLDIQINYFENFNYGYGRGHNENFNIDSDAEYFFVLNDDIFFPNLDWMNRCFKEFHEQQDLAIIGSEQSPQFLDNLANGILRPIIETNNPDYSEGSILLIKSDIFKQINGFDTSLEYCYYEDVDLCLRVKQLGYKIKNITIKHQHFRSSSSSKLPIIARESISELNRAKFLSKWGGFIQGKKENLYNNILIDIDFDGFGDIVDCYYPIKQLLLNNINNNIYMYIPSNLLHLYFSLIFFHPNITFIKKEEINNINYDSIYSTKNLNLSPPYHTMDIIASQFGVVDFDTDPTAVCSYYKNKLKNSTIIKPDKKYIVIHFDSQREGFESRMPNQEILISITQKLSEHYKFIILGKHLKIPNIEFENHISILKDNNIIYDYRDSGSIEDMFMLISGCFMFLGVDSGPSHIAQLLNIPSYIIYGPINPATKIYRYYNSGCYYNLNHESGSGTYHRCLRPSYHYDMRRDENCIKEIDSSFLTTDIEKFISNNFVFNWIPIFDSLRRNQRESILLQMHNPLYKNKILLN